MTEQASTTVSRTSSVKRKSLLSELGIQPGVEPSKPRTSTKPKVPPPTTSRPSKTPVKSTKTPRPVSAPAKKAPPTAIKTERVTPISPTTAPKRRSIVPSPNRPSPLSRRSSVNPSPSSAKRMSTPVGLADFNIKEKVSEKEGLLDQKVKELEKSKLDNEQKIVSLEQKLTDLTNQLESIKAEKASNQEAEEKMIQVNQEAEEKMIQIKQEAEEKMIQIKQESEEKMTQIKLDAIQETENKLKIHHEQEIENLLKEQEKKLESELSTLKSECEHMMEGLNFKNEDIIRQMEATKIENEQLQKQLKLEQEKSQEEENKLEKLTKEINDLNEKVNFFEKTQTSSHVRKIENELNQALESLEEHKQQAQQKIETVEKRHRDEIRQLQSGTDDTAMAWLEKTKATQQEVDMLHDRLRQRELAYSRAVEALRDQYEDEVEELREMCEEKEADIEERSAQVESLLDRVETLQNSLEAATDRLEHTAKSTPSSSSDREEINRTSTHGGHEACVKRYEAKQKELFELKTRLSEAKETHESQLNRLGKEKANAIQELQRTIVHLERQKPMSPPPSINEDNLTHIAEQHKREIKVIHEQYQLEVDSKNRELEDYAYRVKVLVACKQKETEKMETEKREQVNELEREIEGYEIKMKELDKQIKKYQERASHWESLHINTHLLLENTKNGCLAHHEDNEQLLRLVNQLQVELHKA